MLQKFYKFESMEKKININQKGKTPKFIQK